ncbi:MAG TPA: ABC transporter substrate-binding protein [Gammaproteobacteria bacterium]
MHDVIYRPGRRGGLTRRAFLRGSAALGGAALLGGCGAESPSGEASPEQAATGAEAAPFTFLTILPLASLTFAPELMADAGGYFADQGLNVSFQVTRGSPQAIQLVLAGRSPLTRISQIEGMRAAANRAAPVMNVGMVLKESTIRFVSSEKRALRRPEDFVGATIGIPSEGGSSETELDLFLAASGIDPESVQRQVVGLTPGVFNLVEQGRLAGYAVSIDTAKILEQQQPGVVVFNPGEFMASGGQFYMTSKDGFAANRGDIAKYLDAVRAALDFMINDDGFDRTLEIMRRKYSFDGLNDTAIAKESLAEYVRIWTAAGRESLLVTLPERWTRGYEELVNAGLAEPGATPDAWYTNELVREA